MPVKKKSAFERYSDRIHKLVGDVQKSHGKHYCAGCVAVDVIERVRPSEIMKAALIEIAAFNDYAANERLVRTGGYDALNKPSAVKIAREALAACEKENE